MFITFVCQCQREFEVDDQFAGKKTRCPDCDTILTVPSRYKAVAVVVDGPEYEVIDELKSRPAQATTPDYEVIEAEPDRPTRIPPRHSGNQAFEVIEKPPSFRKKKKPKKKELSFEERLYAPSDGYDRHRETDDFHEALFNPHNKVIMGSLLMGGAIAWLMIGLYLGWLFYYPPIMFILGLVSLIRGLLENK